MRLDHPDVIERLNESGTAWIVGEGEACDGTQRVISGNKCRWPAPHAPHTPPADLVAAAEPCVTCWGDGNVIGRHPQGGHITNLPCPARCHDGKPRISLMVKCDCCDCSCGPPHHAATVTAVGDVVPIVECSGSNQYPDHPAILLIPAPVSAAMFYDPTPGVPLHDVTLPANARPGMFALQVEKVAT